MAITPVTSATAPAPVIVIPPASLPDATQVQHAFQSITTLSLGKDPHVFSNLATLSFLQGQVGQASARAILDATISYQKTSVYGSGLSPAALAISDQLSNLYRQIQEQQQLLLDQIAASDAAAQSAWDSGNFWGYVTNTASSLTGQAQLLFNQIAGFFVSAAAVVASFFESCFSSWFRADEDSQSALYIGGINDPQNVFVEDQSLKVLVPGLDPVKDLPREGVTSLAKAGEEVLRNDPENPDNTSVTPVNDGESTDSGDIPGWIPGFISPYQLVGDSETRQSLLEGLQQTRESEEKADILTAEGSAVLDLANGVSSTSQDSRKLPLVGDASSSGSILPGVSSAKSGADPYTNFPGRLPGIAGAFNSPRDIISGSEIDVTESADATISRSNRIEQSWSEVLNLGVLAEQALQVFRKEQTDQSGEQSDAISRPRNLDHPERKSRHQRKE